MLQNVVCDYLWINYILLNIRYFFLYNININKRVNTNIIS